MRKDLSRSAKTHPRKEYYSEHFDWANTSCVFRSVKKKTHWKIVHNTYAGNNDDFILLYYIDFNPFDRGMPFV